MYKYEMIIFWSNEDECYIGEVPELLGCMADGKTYREVLDNVEIVISDLNSSIVHEVKKWRESKII